MLHAQKRTLRVLLALVLASLVAAALQLTNPASVAAARDKPNILLITTDDQSVNDLKYMPITRRLLGADGAGATFKDMVSSYPLCCPARATILTGQLSHNHDIRTNKEPYGGWAKLRNQPEIVERDDRQLAAGRRVPHDVHRQVPQRVRRPERPREAGRDGTSSTPPPGAPITTSTSGSTRTAS